MRARRTSVTIDSGELPSAVGVEEGMPLLQVVGRWQTIAHSRFRDDCRFLKQMIAETDALRLWEKSVGGFTFKDRDAFLREKVLIDYELTERDMAEIVALLKRDEPEAVQRRLTAALREHGGDRRSAAFQSSDATSIGRGVAYLTARLERDHPDIAAALERGEYTSVRQAAIAAGIVHPRTGDPLQALHKAWGKASAEQRASFLSTVVPAPHPVSATSTSR
jgi:hypothetical protein